MQFYKEENFKEIEGLKVPKDWDVKELNKLFDVKTGTTPSTKNKKFWENGNIVWITPSDLSNLRSLYIHDSERKVNNFALQKCNLNLLPKNSIILSTRAPIGYVAINKCEAVFNQGCKGLVPKINLDVEFYAYYLKFIKKSLQNLGAGSTFKELSKKVLESIKLPLPPLNEQKAIAERLKSIDNLIETKKKEKEQVEKAKKEIMNLLLNGKIRLRV
ncbi:restriction endonuclease subunit S [Methanocaldococcus infernus]